MLNSDDPAFFGGYLNYNFSLIIGSLSALPEAEQREVVATLCKNSFAATFLPEDEKAAYIAEVEASAKMVLNA